MQPECLSDIFAAVWPTSNFSHALPVLQELARTAFAAYGGDLEEKPELYEARSVLLHADRLNMPVVLTIGEEDPLIPVATAEHFRDTMKTCGVRSELCLYEGAAHGLFLARGVDLFLEEDFGQLQSLRISHRTASRTRRTPS